jgi:hypothetical protein
VGKDIADFYRGGRRECEDMLFFSLQKVDEKQDTAHQIECTGEEAAIKGSQKGNQNGSGK